jgi:hypothetical protein
MPPRFSFNSDLISSVNAPLVTLVGLKRKEKGGKKRKRNAKKMPKR